MRDMILGLVSLIFGLSALIWLIPLSIAVPNHLPFAALSPALWPKIVAGMIAVAGAVLAVQGALEVRRRAREEGADGGSATTFGWHTLRTVFAMLLLIPYYVACERLGLLLPSVPAFAAFALLAGERRYVPLAVTALVLPVALSWFFLHAANVVIPLGPLTGLL